MRQAGEPITVGTGNVFEQIEDYTTAGQNPLSLTRYYNSLGSTIYSGTSAHTLGVNWRGTYDSFLHISPATGQATSVVAERADGQVISFAFNGSTWTTDTDVDATLAQSGSTWTLKDHNDTVFIYTANSSGIGLLNSITVRNGYTQTLSYNGSNQLTSVTDSYRRTLTLTYNSNGLLNTVGTPDGLGLTYGYSSSGTNGTTLDTSPVTSQTYVYGNSSFPFALTSRIDENGNTANAWAFDTVGRAISSEWFSAVNTPVEQTTFAYNANGTVTVTNPLGEQDTYTFTTPQNVPKVTGISRAAIGTVAAASETMTYDANGYLNQSTDWNGNVTTYVNDTHGDPTIINEAVGSAVARTTNIVYDTTWVHLPHTVAKPGFTVTNDYDAAKGNLLTRVITDTTSQTSPYATNGQTRTWTYTWTATGQLRSVRLPRRDVVAKTTYGYIGGALTSIIDAASHKTTILTYTGGGLPLTITDANGVLTTLSYDARLRLHSNVLTTAAGNLTTTWDHDAAGNLIRLTLPDGSYTMYGYDNAHRLTLITNALGETQQLTLDAMDDMTETLWENASSVITRQHNATYDALGRRMTDVGGMGQTTTFGYDSQGNLTSIETPLTWTTGQAFDALNRISTVTDPYGNTTNYTYDAQDRPLTVTDPNGHATSFVYDGFGDMIEQKSPDSGTTVYHYDADGNLARKIDAAHATTDMTYDALDRILTRVYPADSTEKAVFTYDQSGHGDGVGRLTSLTDAAGALSLSYDERGNRLTNVRTIGTSTYATTYTYDGASRTASIVYPTAGWTISYARDAAGQVTSVSATRPGNASINLATAVTHSPFGPVNAFAWGNGVSHATSFDLDYRQTNLTDTGASIIQNLAYDYDADNNAHIITDAIKAANSQTLNYDELERLTNAVSGAGGYGSLSYTYDNNGNRKTAGAKRYTIAPASDRLTDVGGVKILYTATGNMEAIGPDTMTYNQGNRLAVAQVAGTSSLYTYDAFGQRLEAQVGGGATSVESYDLAGHQLTETNSGIETDYAYLDGMPIAVIQPGAATIQYIHADRLGTPQKVTNASKETVWSTTYQPFGVTRAITGSITQNLRLPGQYADATGFNHNEFRDYDPSIGRYLESDPIGLAGGLNTYAYVGDNPIMGRDPSGLFYIPFTNQDVDLTWAESVAADLEPFAEYCAAEKSRVINFLVASAAAIRLGESAKGLGESSTNLGNLLQCNTVDGECNATFLEQAQAAQFQALVKVWKGAVDFSY
jgi:RHS repeat-associated protein